MQRSHVLKSTSHISFQVKEASNAECMQDTLQSLFLTIFVVLIAALVSLICYIKLRARREAKIMYARRDKQGGYSGPGSNDSLYHNAFPRVSHKFVQHEDILISVALAPS